MRKSGAQLVPFLVVNHLLDPARLRRWAREFAAAGCDGFFIHPREGLLTPYLSEAWFEAVEACVDEARRGGIKAWLYDEFPYPSGVAGGRVVESDSRFAERHLQVRRYRFRGGIRRTAILGRDPVLRAFLCPVRNGKSDERKARDVTSHIGPVMNDWLMRDWDSGHYYSTRYAKPYNCPRAIALRPSSMFEANLEAGTWELAVFFVRTGGDFIEPFGHYVDVSNREATEAFLRFTHEEYRKRLGRHFRSVIPGIFTDEPKYRNNLPWSDTIEKNWLDYQKNPASLLSLLGNEKSGGAVRRRYRETIHRLFRENWARPISRWCARHGLKFTGHISPEEDWMVESRTTGSILQLLKEFHLPGCDLVIPAVGDRDHPILNFIPSLATSVSAQQGRSHTLCELFGASNYSMNMQDVKRIGDWLSLFGINFFTVHYMLYSNDGYRKWDAPPTFCHPSPLWPHFKKWKAHLDETAGRLGPLKVRVRLVMVRPMRSFWRTMADTEVFARGVYERAMKLALNLLEKGVLFHWMDDLDLAKASVRGGRIHLGKARYDELVHFSGSLDAEVAKHLHRLKIQGGRVLNDQEAARLAGPLRSKRGDIRAVQASDRRWFCVNLSSKGQSFSLNEQTHRLEGYESRWLAHGEKAAEPPRIRRNVRLSSDWSLEPESDNVLVLKHWTLNGRPTRLAPWHDVAPRHEIGGMEKGALGEVPIQPDLKDPKQLVYQTRFHIRGRFPISLVCERDSLRGEWAATLNGRSLKAWRKKERYDLFNLEHDLRFLARPGMNILTFQFTIRKSTEGMIEPCRLFGLFQVAPVGRDITPPAGVNGINPQTGKCVNLYETGPRVPNLLPVRKMEDVADWARSGYPHYSGVMRYKRNFRWQKRSSERVELVLEQPPRDQVEVRLNGRPVGAMLWSPWRLDVTPALRDGENRIELRISNTLTNMIHGRPRPSGLNGGVVLCAP